MLFRSGLTFCQLTALFSVPLVVYHAFGLTGSGALDIIGTQALVTLAVALLRFDLVANLGGGLGLLLLFGAVVNGALTAGMLCLMFLPNAARRLTGGVLSLLVRVRLVRHPEEAREKLEKQMEEYRRGADCVRRNPALVPALLGDRKSVV